MTQFRVLRLRNESETIVTSPPADRVVVIGVEPPALDIAARVEETRVAIGILDGFVHDDDPNETHGFELFVREVLPDEASHFGVRFREVPLGGFGANLLCDAVFVREERPFQDSNLGGDVLGGLEVLRAKDLLGVVAETIPFLLETLGPLWASGTVGSDGQVDDTILHTKTVSWFRNHQFISEESVDSLHAAEFVYNRFDLTEIQFSVFHVALAFLLDFLPRGFSLPVSWGLDHRWS